MSRLLLGRALLVAGTEPDTALAALRVAVREFRAEDDVSNLLSCLLAAAHAMLLQGRDDDGVALAASVRHEAARRGLNFEPVDPPGAAALNAALAHATPAAGASTRILDEAAMIALLDT
jgi:hypothetical protein